MMGESASISVVDGNGESAAWAMDLRVALETDE